MSCPTCGMPLGAAAAHTRQLQRLERARRFSLLSAQVCLVAAGLNLSYAVGNLLG